MKHVYRSNANILMDEAYETRIKKLFNQWIRGFSHIECYAIVVILPNNDMLHLSTHPLLSRIYCENQYGKIDQPTATKLYRERLFYPWRQPNPTKRQEEVHTIREKIFNINSGTNFTRKVTTDEGTFYIIYCVSSYQKNILNYFRFAMHINEIFESGDFAYHVLLPIFQENTAYHLPTIKDTSIQLPQHLNLFDNHIMNKAIADEISLLMRKTPILNANDDTLRNQLRVILNDKFTSNHSSKQNIRCEFKVIK